MKRGRRIISWGCDIVCVVAIGLILFQYTRPLAQWDTVGRLNASGETYAITVQEGAFWIEKKTANVLRLNTPGWGTVGGPSIPFAPERKWSFEFDWGNWGWHLAIPYWVPILILAVKPTWHLITWCRRRRLTEDGHVRCIACGYNLHGIESETCPECGVGFSPS